MVSAFWRAASRVTVPLSAAYLSQCHRSATKAEPAVREKPVVARQQQPDGTILRRSSKDHSNVQGMRPDEEGDYYGLFPKRQLWHPKFEYPLWDPNWDGKEPPSTGNDDEDRRQMRKIRKNGVTRHIILIRHGQYDERFKEDEKRTLTPLGAQQAELTGKRLAEMLKGAEEHFGPCRIRALRVSGMIRARETADIIASYIPQVEYVEPDPMLNEGRPCHHIPGGKASSKIVEATDHGHARIEEAFQKYFQRADYDDQRTPDGEGSNPQTGVGDEVKHEFEIIVCHANVIRYFLCRALQLPPEAWLRYCPFNCSLTYLTIRPTGTVSCRLLGDIGHIPYGMSTFSQHQGFNW